MEYLDYVILNLGRDRDKNKLHDNSDKTNLRSRRYCQRPVSIIR